MAEWLQNYIGGVCATDHSISEGGYAQKITVLHRGRVSRDSKRWLRNLYTTPEWCLLTIDFLLLIILNSFFATSFLTHIWLGYPIKGWWIYWKVCKPWKICKICQRYKRQTKPISPCFIFFRWSECLLWHSTLCDEIPSSPKTSLRTFWTYWQWSLLTFLFLVDFWQNLINLIP